MRLIPMGGKSASNTAIGVSVDDNGRINTKRIWQNKKITLMNALSIRDTSAHTTVSTVCDCSESAMVSLRFINTLGMAITVTVYDDINSSGTDYMKDFDGSVLSFNIPEGHIIVTPDDMPWLKYMNYLKLRVQTSSAPSAGALTIEAYLKG